MYLHNLHNIICIINIINTINEYMNGYKYILYIRIRIIYYCKKI